MTEKTKNNVENFKEVTKIVTTHEVVKEILTELSEGKLALSKILNNRGLTRYAFNKYLLDNPDLTSLHTQALESRTEALAEEVIEIADTDKDPQRARNRIDARKWTASKMMPHKYGDRIDINLKGSIDIRGVLADARSRVIEVIQANEMNRVESDNVPLSDAKAIEDIMGE